jgi:hypothetical protein
MHLGDIPQLGCVIIVHIRGESLVLSIYIFESYTRNTNSIRTSTLFEAHLVPSSQILPRDKRLYPICK